MNRAAVWCVLLVLVALHHDFWFWDDPSLVAGWLPIGLVWHLGLSLAAVAFWALTVKFAWPRDLEVAVTDAPAASATGSESEVAK
jgi:hypothetical protein